MKWKFWQKEKQHDCPPPGTNLDKWNQAERCRKRIRELAEQRADVQKATSLSSFTLHNTKAGSTFSNRKSWITIENYPDFSQASNTLIENFVLVCDLALLKQIAYQEDMIEDLGFEVNRYTKRQENPDEDE